MKRAWGIWDETSQKWLPNPLTGQFGGPARYKTRGEAERAADQDWRPLNPDRVFTVKLIKEGARRPMREPESRDPQAPYTIEDVNTLTGSRNHRRASKYETYDDAHAQATAKAKRTRSFVHYNILDNRERVVATLKGETGEEVPPGSLGESPQIVADFDTLDDLIQHAAVELGATHVAGDGAHTKLYFPRGGQYPYEEAKVWKQAGYWHSEKRRVGVETLPSDARSIGRAQGRRAAENRGGHVRDYIAFDRRGRPIGPPFKRYGDARDKAERAGGHVEFVPKHVREKGTRR